MRRFVTSAVAVAVALAVFAPITPGHAVYQKVETFEDRYAVVDSTDCTALTPVCTEVFVQFGFDESDSIQKYVIVEVYLVDRTGPVTVFTLTHQGAWYDSSLSIVIAANRKSAALSGFVDLAQAPCDQFALTCSGPVTSKFVQVAATASSAKSGSLKKNVVEVPPCKVTRSGSYSQRRSKTGTVTVDGTSFNAVPVTGSVVIRKDAIKVTSRDCLGLSGIVTPMMTTKHHASAAKVVRHVGIR